MKKNTAKKYILYVGSIQSYRKVLEDYVLSHGLPWKFISLVPEKSKIKHREETDLFHQIQVNFDNAQEMQDVIERLGKNLAAAVNRGERNIPNFQKLLPYLPERLLVPSVEALTNATEKSHMRKAFRRYDKTITPKFEVLKDASPQSMSRIIKRLEFPVIIKPAGLAQSVLVQAAHYPEELEKVLKTVFRKMTQAYKKMKGRGIPSVLVEEIIKGDQYSVDAFVDVHGIVQFCPFVKYTTGEQKGFDDFFSYEQTVPANISKESIQKAKEVAVKGIYALGLRNSSAHIELIRRDGMWYLVEIGPRIGGFRSMMYQKSFGINLDIQDIHTHLGKPLKIPRKKKGYTSVIKFFPKKEGTITKILGLKNAKRLLSFHEIHQAAKRGDKALFAKNGGTYVFRITLFNSDKAQFTADKRKLEKMISIETTRQRKVATLE